MERIIRVARPDDMADIMAVMDAAKKIMRQSGNLHQWAMSFYSFVNLYTASVGRMTNSKSVVSTNAYEPK